MIYAIEALYNGKWIIQEVYTDLKVTRAELSRYDSVEDCRIMSYKPEREVPGKVMDYSNPYPPLAPLKKQFEEGYVPDTQGGETWASKSQNPYAYIPE